MRFSGLVSALLSTVFIAQQVSCAQISSWWDVSEVTKLKKNITEARVSIRVPAGSDPEGTYWEAMFFNKAYMGIQHNSGSERRILFSVWDDEHGGKVVPLEWGNKTKIGTFGGEGTGGQSVIFYDWKTEDTIFFKGTIDPQPAKNGTIYTAYYSTDDGKTWNLIASFLRQNVLRYTMYDLSGFLEQFNESKELREGYWGNHTVVTSDNETYRITDFSLSLALYNHSEIYVHKTHIGPNDEYYERIFGTKSEGIYPLA